MNYLSPFWFLEVYDPPVVPRDWAISVYRGQTASGSGGDAKDFTKNIIPLKLRSQSAPLTTVSVFLWGKGCWLAHPLNLGDGSSSRIRQAAFNFTCERAERWLMEGGG